MRTPELLLTRPCTIYRHTAGDSTDIYGNKVVDTTTVQTTCELQQRQRREDTDRGEVALSAWLLILPADTNVDLGDQVAVDGARFEVSGDPWFVRHPATGEASHVEVGLERAAAADDPQVGS